MGDPPFVVDVADQSAITYGSRHRSQVNVPKGVQHGYLISAVQGS